MADTGSGTVSAGTMSTAPPRATASTPGATNSSRADSSRRIADGVNDGAVTRRSRSWSGGSVVTTVGIGADRSRIPELDDRMSWRARGRGHVVMPGQHPDVELLVDLHRMFAQSGQCRERVGNRGRGGRVEGGAGHCRTGPAGGQRDGCPPTRLGRS